MGSVVSGLLGAASFFAVDGLIPSNGNADTLNFDSVIVPKAGKNLYENSNINPMANPKIEPNANPNINPVANTDINPSANPNINPYEQLDNGY